MEKLKVESSLKFFDYMYWIQGSIILHRVKMKVAVSECIKMGVFWTGQVAMLHWCLLKNHEKTIHKQKVKGNPLVQCWLCM